MRSVAAQLAQALRYRGQSMVVLEREPPSFHAVGIGFALERNRRVHNVGVLIAHVVLPFRLVDDRVIADPVRVELALAQFARRGF